MLDVKGSVLQDNETWSLMDFLHWSIGTRNNESAKELASYCLKSLKVASEYFLVESKRVPCCGPLLTAQSARSSLNPRSLSRKSQGRVPFWREKKLPEAITFWRNKTSVMKRLKRASVLRKKALMN
ncbi:4317_t:CDS:2 [Acaulospora morrowiae]|uniref:4317_t:CDS:1 n=1 Tax=Acaulospora morrowiae TaxID=94023 RepID=A0A9N9BJV8_9GLOM|nr:4317_t:CDS:2 [Acaulospora morrowiae]